MPNGCANQGRSPTGRIPNSNLKTRIIHDPELTSDVVVTQKDMLGGLHLFLISVFLRMPIPHTGSEVRCSILSGQSACRQDKLPPPHLY